MARGRESLRAAGRTVAGWEQEGSFGGLGRHGCCLAEVYVYGLRVILLLWRYNEYL